MDTDQIIWLVGLAYLFIYWAAPKPKSADYMVGVGLSADTVTDTAPHDSPHCDPVAHSLVN